jgi:transposase
MTEQNQFIGIDVSKRSLDIYVRPSVQLLHVPNTALGLVELAQHLPSGDRSDGRL